MFTVRKSTSTFLSTCNCALLFLFLPVTFPPLPFVLFSIVAHPNQGVKKSSTVMLVSKMRGHAAEAVKKFREFNEDFGCRGAERGGLGIVSSEGKLPPATVTSLQHSFPQSWNNRDPHHSPHLCLLFTLSHTFLPHSSFTLTHIYQESLIRQSASCSILPVEEGSRPHKVWLWNLTTIFLLISGPDIAQTHSGGERQTQQSSFFIVLSDITHCCPPFPLLINQYLLLHNALIHGTVMLLPLCSRSQQSDGVHHIVSDAGEAQMEAWTLIASQG